MDELMKIQEQLAAIKAERDELAAEVERLKSGKFDAGDYIKKLQQQAERDKAAEEALKARFI